MDKHNNTQLFARLRAHLHRGGAWDYLWILESRASVWAPTDRPLAIPRGRVNVYFGVHPVAQAKTRAQRATNADVSAINCLFVDLDAKDFGAAGEGKARAWAHLAQFTPAPSVIVDSGGGYHGYWLLREPFGLVGPTDQDRARRAQARWVAFVGGDPGAKDLARILRVPGTLNFKSAYAPNYPRVMMVRADWARQYTLDELERAASVEMRAGGGVPRVPMGVAREGRAARYGRAALLDELARLARAREGGRNTQLNASAFALGQLVGQGALTRTEVETRLFDAARVLGLEERETLVTIRSGIEAGLKKLRAGCGTLAVF